MRASLKSSSPKAAPGSWVSPASWIAWASGLCRNSSHQSLTLCSRTTVMGFVQTEALTTLSKQLVPMCVGGGHRLCAELDLEKFFDRVNHDVLMAYVERQIEAQTCARSHSPLSRSGNDVRRYHQTASGGGAARLPALAVAVEHHAQRTRPRARTVRGRRAARWQQSSSE